MVLPGGGELQEFGDGLALERAFDLVDAGDGGANAVDFALVLVADELGYKPLDPVKGMGMELKLEENFRNTGNGVKTVTSSETGWDHSSSGERRSWRTTAVME